MIIIINHGWEERLPAHSCGSSFILSEVLYSQLHCNRRLWRWPWDTTSFILGVVFPDTFPQYRPTYRILGPYAQITPGVTEGVGRGGGIVHILKPVGENKYGHDEPTRVNGSTKLHGFWLESNKPPIKVPVISGASKTDWPVDPPCLGNPHWGEKKSTRDLYEENLRNPFWMKRTWFFGTLWTALTRT